MSQTNIDRAEAKKAGQGMLVDDPIPEKLLSGIQQLKLDLSSDQHRQLFSYLQLFDKWNKAYNLSAVRNIDDMLSRHLFDSLSIASYLQGRRFIDVGTGGGLPGIPLAITFPDYQFFLLDSNGKKTRFLFQVKQELGLDNVEVVQSRVEKFIPEQHFDGVISRAFASLDAMLSGSHQLLTPQGKFYAMKGQRPEVELAAIGGMYRLEKCESLMVPDCIAERHLIIISQNPNEHTEA